MLMSEKPVKWDIPWESLEGIIKGISAIDMNSISIRNLEEAERFILNYGYDFHNPKDREELTQIEREAISFIERRFLYPDSDREVIGFSERAEKENIELPDIHIPDLLISDFDVRRLLVQASEERGMQQLWACAILKVMHTISHINNAILYHWFEEARSQILSRYYKILLQTETGELLLGPPGDLRLSIAGFEIKDGKSKDSMILKLLCKRENVAEEVFDMIGVRIITHTSAEAVLAFEILRRNKVVIFPNIISGRSRNSLIDFDKFKTQYKKIMDSYQCGKTELEEMLKLIQEISPENALNKDNNKIFNPDNSSTLASYRAIHITERQLIRFRPSESEKETRFFFPYEIQIVDESAYIQNHSGSSAHMLYKQNQLVQARRRVLGPLFAEQRKEKQALDKDLEPKPGLTQLFL